MPISAGDFRKGVVFEMDGKPMLVVDFQHVKPGKGAAFVRTKYKNVMTGAIREVGLIGAHWEIAVLGRLHGDHPGDQHLALRHRVPLLHRGLSRHG